MRYQSILSSIYQRQEGEFTKEELALYNSSVPEIQELLEDLYQDGIQRAEDAPNNYQEAFLFFLGILSSLTASLTNAIQELLLDSWNLGGEIALGEMGIDGQFSIQNTEQIEQEAERQVQIIVETTARQLAEETIKLKTANVSGKELLIALVAFGVANSILRAGLITERQIISGARDAFLLTLLRNGVLYVIFKTQEDEKVDNGDPSGPCAIRDGVLYYIPEMPQSSRIPIHFGCRCYYLAVLDNWTAPESPWTG